MNRRRTARIASTLRLYSWDELWGYGKTLPIEEWATYTRFRLLVASCPWRPWLRLKKDAGFSDTAIARYLGVSVELWQKTKARLIRDRKITVWKDNIIYAYFFRKAFDKAFLPLYYDGNIIKERQDENFKVREEIVAHLNKVTGRHYTTSAVSTLKSIDARIKEGASVDDFKKVIEVRWAALQEDLVMRELYMKPMALFSKPNFTRALAVADKEKG